MPHHYFMQFSYSPRVLGNCGLTDGEATERLWSYLRRLAKITKEMRPSHRIDIVTSALLHYSAKVRCKLGVYVCACLPYGVNLNTSSLHVF